jgi:two-component system, OmpR family, sensor kinase
MSLRARLLAGLLGLSLAGLVAVGGGTYLALRSFLLDRVDQQLVTAQRLVDAALASAHGASGRTVDTRLLRQVAPPNTFLQLRDRANRIETSLQIGPTDEPTPAPRLPAALHLAVGGRSSSVVSFGADAVRGTGRYRVQASWLRAGAGILVVAVPLDDVNDTLARLLQIEAVVIGAVLALLAMGAFWLLRAGLGPLERIAGTAAGIADGDLAVRVAPADPHSEIGRLGLALNGMLERLQDAFARRDRSEAELRRFVAGASHELRTPLTSIRGYAALFRRGAQHNPEHLATSMQRIESEATRMGTLIDDMLLLARLDEKRPLDRKTVDLTEIALDAAQDAHARDPDQPITVHHNGPLIVIGDDQRLQQVAANLLANAQTHTPPGTPVEVVLSARDDQAILTVTDHGPGIDPEDAPHVFERFYRGTATSAAAQHSGSGLGLATVAAIIHAHSGTVTLKSKPGHGATFEVALPRRTGWPTNAEQARPQLAVTGPRTNRWRGAETHS